MHATQVRSLASPTGAAPLPGALLILAAAIVGLAIAADGTAARLLNGLGGLAWLVAAALLAGSVRRDRRLLVSAVVTLTAVLTLALAVRPRDLLAALVGFAVAGALVAGVARDYPLRWALLVPAAWLPVHLAIAVLRALGDGAPRVRTDPPPTATIVPVAMVLAALAGGWAVGRWRESRTPRPPELRSRAG